MQATTATTTTPASRGDDHFDELADYVRSTFAQAAGKPLFRVAAPNLWALFLQNLPEGDRQVHNCNCCRHFIERFGNLVTIAADGQQAPALWSDGAPEPYRDSIAAMAAVVARAPVEGVFLSSLPDWGQAVTGEWHHFQVKNPRPFAAPLKTASQAMAERLEERGMLQRGLAEFPQSVVEKATTILQAEALYRSEKVAGVADWLLGLQRRLEATKNVVRRDNMIWLAVATAPPGFAHVRSTMIGTLLEDLAAGMDFEAVRRRFAEKMHPLQYQRPQAPPSNANIEQAEKAVATLKSAGALERRFAQLADIVALWTPRAVEVREDKGGGVFGHLKNRATPAGAAPPIDGMPAQTMTWDKFARTVLPTAERIEFKVPHGTAPFIALVTAADLAAPPILQWDSPEQRNPVSWYLYASGSPAAWWNLTAGAWCPVTAVTLLPPMWHAPERNRHHGEGVILLLEGCRDTHHQHGGGLFPETLRSEYHAFRRTLEAHSNRATIAGRDEATACGFDLRKGARWEATVRVTSKGTQLLYRLDRWD